ncbi:hypothetical protein BaRGS_00010944 [Batillaria attramentaria]|uniref:CEP152 CEP63 binding coiled coil domain-containing protein n=1 Tax=Batillaria attramentaria TaxID=370345 RepID=A0ABD0LEE6_9CAEN
MSTNVSLANAGTSLNFDGQALQNQQEAEIEREEQLQQHELRQLLSNAFDDLEDDILSVASSEGDSVNISHASVHQESFRGPFSPVAVQHDGAVSERSESLAARTPSTAASPAVASPHSSVTQSSSKPSPFFLDTSIQSSSSKSNTGNGRFLQSTQRDLLHFTAEQKWSSFGTHFRGQNQPERSEYNQGKVIPHDDGNLDSAGEYYKYPPHGRSDYTLQHENQHLDDSSQQLQHGFSNPSEQHGYSDPREKAKCSQYWMDSTGTSGSHNGHSYGNQTESGLPSHTSSNPLHGQYTDVGQMYQNYSQPAGSRQQFLQSYAYEAHPVEHDFETAARQNSSDNSTQHVTSSFDWERNRESETGPRTYAPTAYSSTQGWQHVPEHDVPVEDNAWYKDSSVSRDRQFKGVDFSLPSDAQGNDKSTSEDDFLGDYKVLYKKSRPVSQTEPAKAAELDIQQDFVHQEGFNEEMRQLSQLQILYRSRGRQLEDVSAELEKVQLESAKERRMLKHLLSVATGEKEGVERSLQESQKLLQEAKETQSQVSGKLQATEVQLQAMKEAKEELSKRLQSAETTIENLTHQLAELRESDSLSQARSQHDAVVSSMQQRFDKEILTLKEKLDAANESIAEKNKEIAGLWKQVSQQTQLAEQAQISRGETINQLTRSLEESQRRCQGLLEASSTEEVSVLKAQLQQALVSKSMADSMCTSLQTEMRELKEQLSMLESASSLGAFSGSLTPQGTVYTDDSMADLGIRKTLDFSTPDSAAKFDGSQSSEDLIRSLRRELERCLVSNKQKRVLVVELQEQKRHLQQQVTEVQEELAATRKLVDSQQVKLKSFQDRFGDGLQGSAVESRLNKEIENLQREKLALSQDIDDYKMRLNEVSTSEERLTEVNRKLNQQIAEMVREHDEDKRESIDRCRRTCEDAHITAREHLERSLRSEFFADKQELILKYEKQLTDSREAVQQLQEELDRVKEMYVESSRSLAQQDDKLRTDYNNNLHAELNKELELKEQWEREQAEAVRQAVKATQDEWEEKIKQKTQELEQRFAAEQAQWEREKQTTMETLIQQRLEKERRSWQVQTDREALDQVDMAVEAAKRQWADETRQELLAVKAELEQCSLTHQAELAQIEEKWQRELADERAALEKELKTRFQNTLQQEVEQRLADQKKMLMSEAESTLLHKLTELEAVKTEELERRMKEEKEWLEAELTKRLETETKNAVDLARTQWETNFSEERKKMADSGTQEVARWRAEVTRLQGELKAQAAQWEDAQSRLIREKDEERRRAVTKVRSQCEEDYHRFMEDNKATLDSALAAARQEHCREMEEQAARHKEEMAALRAVEQELRKALADSRSGDKSPGNRLTPSTDQQLARKLEKLKKEIGQRDELLRQADTHMEQEVRRLRESLEENYTRQREKDSLRVQAQYTQAMHISQKERTRLERQLETVMEELRQEKERHAEQVESMKARLAEQAESLERLAEQDDVEEVLSQLQQEKEEKEQVLNQLHDSHTVIDRLSQERDSLISQLAGKDAHLQEERSRLSGRVSECQAAIKALDAERTSLADKLDSVTQQHTEELVGVRHKLDQTKARLRQVEAALSAVNKQHREDVQKVTETMTNSHQHEIQELHTQLAQIKKQHELMLEEVEQKHQAEKQDMMEQVRRQAQRALAHTPTQTDNDDSLYNLKGQYVNTVHKIKGEVMSHISMSNQRAAMTIKNEIRMERQRTIQHLHRRCRSRLRRVIQGQSEGCGGEEVWQMMDAALDSLFDSVSSSLSATPSTSAGVTPRSSEEDGMASDVAVDTERGPMDEKHHDLPVPHQRPGHANTSSSSGNQSVGAFSTPQSVESDRYALPSALGKVELFDQGQSDMSLAELQGSGVFFPLVPDETASVTDVLSDTDQDFKQPLPLRKGNKHKSKLEELSQKLAKFPVKGGKTITAPGLQTATKTFPVFSKEPTKSQADAMFSPKLHRKSWVKEEMGVSGESVGWKDVDAGVWTEAVGSTNLWQAYTDLKDMELSDKQPRRQLRFQSQTFMDGYTDSDTDCRNGETDMEGNRLAATTAEKETAVKSSTHRSALVSRSSDFSRKIKTLSVRYKSMEDLIPESSVDELPVPGSLKQSHTTPDLFRPKDYDPSQSYTPHKEKEKSLTNTVPSKLLLNPKNFLSKPAQKPVSTGGKPEGREPETLDSMMARLGFSKTTLNMASADTADEDDDTFLPKGRHSDSFVFNNRKSAFSTGRKSDSFMQEKMPLPGHGKEPLEHGASKEPRAHSAGDVSCSRSHQQDGHSSGKFSSKQLDLHRLLKPEPSKEPTVPRHISHSHTRHGHRHRSDDLVQRSLEEHQVKEKFYPPLSHNERSKSRSEQALHVLGEAFGTGVGRDGGDSVYHYTPLQRLLSPASPSTSLLSTYSVSEGDLRLTPYEIVGKESERF